MNIVRELRKALDIKQGDFAKRISTTQGHVSDIENGRKDLSERTIKIICMEFNVNEDWLRTGEGEMFLQPSTFSLDEYAKQNKLSDLEMDIIKGYISLDVNTRKTLISHFKSIFDNHNKTAMTKEDYIDRELEDYRLELEAEQKGIMSSALPDTKEKDA